ncbi:MAG: hypothetical protein ACLVEJ_12375 [Parabacteroides sp.]
MAHGGDRYTPVDEERSNEEQDVLFDETKAFSRKFSPVLNGDVSLNYRMEQRASYLKEFSLKIAQCRNENWYALL